MSAQQLERLITNIRNKIVSHDVVVVAEDTFLILVSPYSRDELDALDDELVIGADRYTITERTRLGEVLWELTYKVSAA